MSPAFSDREEEARYRRLLEERLGRLSVLQELTVAASRLFDPAYPANAFLERLAERLGCVAALWLTREAEGGLSLFGAAGLAQTSRALSLPATGPCDPGLVLPYPELDPDPATRWVFPLEAPCVGRECPAHALILCFESAAKAPASYRGAVERLVEVIRNAIAHRQVLEDLQRSYGALERTQRSLVERERLAAVGELAAMVAHEVRNPLGVIYNSVGTLRRGPVDAADRDLLLQIMGEEAERLNKIVGDLLEFARPQQAELAQGSIDEVIQAAIARATAKGVPAGVSVEAEPGGALPRVPIDERLLRQALINLVSNAMEAMPDGGHVAVRARTERERGQEWVRIEVEDDGPGIPQELLARVYEPFFTTKPFGTGLGLAIVRRVVEAHQGELRVRSEEGAGTTFALRIPVHPATAEPRPG